MAKDGWYHLVPDAVVMRSLGQRPKQLLTCYCCKRKYERGSFSCCAPPKGMASHRWLEMTCPDPPKGCGKCATHCQCPSKADRLGKGPLAAFGREFLENPAAFVARANSPRDVKQAQLGEREPGEDG